MTAHERAADEPEAGRAAGGWSPSRITDSLQPLAFPVGAVFVAAGLVALRGAPVVETLLLSFLVVTVGLQGVWGFLGHYFKADEIADYIGWPAGNPFQTEVAFANLAFAVLGLLCIPFRSGFWLATAFGVSVFLLGAASVHVREMREHDNFNLGNAGSIFLTDVLTPIALLALYSW